MMDVMQPALVTPLGREAGGERNLDVSFLRRAPGRDVQCPLCGGGPSSAYGAPPRGATCLLARGMRCVNWSWVDPEGFTERTSPKSIAAHLRSTVGHAQHSDVAEVLEVGSSSRKVVPRRGLEPPIGLPNY